MNAHIHTRACTHHHLEHEAQQLHFVSRRGSCRISYKNN